MERRSTEISATQSYAEASLTQPKDKVKDPDSIFHEQIQKRLNVNAEDLDKYLPAD